MSAVYAARRCSVVFGGLLSSVMCVVAVDSGGEPNDSMQVFGLVRVSMAQIPVVSVCRMQVGMTRSQTCLQIRQDVGTAVGSASSWWLDRT